MRCHGRESGWNAAPIARALPGRGQHERLSVHQRRSAVISRTRLSASFGVACLLSSGALALPPEAINGPSAVRVCESRCRTSTTPALCYSACSKLAGYGGTPGGNVPPEGFVSVPPGAAVVVSLGDSVMWGEGIPELQNGPTPRKFVDLVAQWLQFRYQGSRQVFTLPSRAHAGAQIHVDSASDTPFEAWGEIPSSTPSIPLQVDLTVGDLQAGGSSPDAVVLVLVDGCINDVQVESILNPANASADVAAWTHQWCPNMGPLLKKLLTTFRNAAIVVTGYFPIASPDSNLAELWGLATALVGPLGGAALALDAKDRLIANSNAFASTSFSDLSSAVSQANQPGQAPRVALAWPAFDKTSSYAASNTLLWRVGQFSADEGNGIFGINQPAVDSPNFVAWSRAAACNAISRGQDPTCVDASMGHPDLDGEVLYADTIEAQLATTLSATLNFPPSPPRHALAVTVSFGSDGNGPVVVLAPGSPPIKLTNWAVVHATAIDTGKPVLGAPVAVVPEIAGQPAAGQGVTGSKFYYLCKAAVQTPPRNSVLAPVVAGTCRGTVQAAGGYGTADFAVNATRP